MAKPAAPKNALQAQLLKAGLADQQKLAKTNRQQRHDQHTGAAQRDQQQLAEKIAADQAAKLERDRLLAAQQKALRDAKAIDAAIRQMTTHHRLTGIDGDQPYRFVDGNKIKKIHIKPEIFEKIVAGHLWVVRLDDRHAVVPRLLGEKIAEKRPDLVLVGNQPAAQSAGVDAEDPYAAFVIPDDLMW